MIESFSESFQTSRNQVFYKNSNFQPLNIIPNRSILDVWQDSEYAASMILLFKAFENGFEKETDANLINFVGFHNHSKHFFRVISFIIEFASSGFTWSE